MNDFSTIENSGAELKDFYGSPQAEAIRIRRKKKAEELDKSFKPKEGTDESGSI